MSAESDQIAAALAEVTASSTALALARTTAQDAVATERSISEQAAERRIGLAAPPPFIGMLKQGPAYSIRSIAFSTPTVTVTVDSGHTVAVSDVITISGATTSGNNGTFAVTGIPGTAIVFANASGAVQAGQ